MPRRDPHPHRSDPETRFDTWLDAFVAGTSATGAPPDDPSGSLAGAMAGARQLHGLAARSATPPTAAQQRIREELMRHGALAAPGGTTWIPDREGNRAQWWSPAGTIAPTVLALAAILALVASLVWIQRPVRSLRFADAPGFAVASPGATPATTDSRCDVTPPNEQAPPGEDDLSSWLGSGTEDPSLWLLMTWDDGVQPITSPGSDGYPVKLTFWRGEGSGPVEVTATGPDRETLVTSAFEPFRDTAIPGMHPVAGTLPTPGCWTFTATDGDDSLHWTILVEAASVDVPAATPATTPEPAEGLDSVIITEGSAEQAGIEGDVRIATLGEHGIALPVAGGEIVTILEITGFTGNTIDDDLVVYREGQSPAALDVDTGEIVRELPEFHLWGREWGRWYLEPVDDGLTDWTITDMVTGETRLLSELVGLPDGASVMPIPTMPYRVGGTQVFEFQPGEPVDRRWVPAGASVGSVLLSSEGHVMPLPDFPTLLDDTGSPMLIAGAEGRIVAHETRAGDDRIVVVDTATGEELAWYSTADVGEDPTLAGFLGDAQTLVVTSDDRVLFLQSDGSGIQVVREGLDGIANPLLYPDEAVLWFTQGDAVMRMSLPDDELTEIASGFVPGALSFTRQEGSDWIFFQTQEGVTLVEAASGEIVSQLKLPGSRGGLPGADQMHPSWTDAEGDTVIIGMEWQGRDSSGVPGAVRLLSPEYPNGLEVAGPSGELPLANAYLSPDGTTLFALARGQTSSRGELWATPLGEEPAWELLAEEVNVITIVPPKATD